jgi:hypothetical protein
MAIKAVIWDLGGVILRTEEMAPRDSLAKRLGLSREEINHIVFEADERNSAQWARSMATSTCKLSA